MDGVLWHQGHALPGAADFLSRQLPGGSAYVVGEAGLTTALHEAGDTLTDGEPDDVVLGEGWCRARLDARDDVGVHAVPDHGRGLCPEGTSTPP